MADKIDLIDLLAEVSNMSFEEGKAYILSKYPKVEENYIYDDGRYDYDFCFEGDDELMITYTSSYERTSDDYIVNYENGYWHIHGEQIKNQV